MATMWRKGMHFLGLGPDEDYDQEGAHDDFLDLRDPPVEEGPAAVRPLTRERGSASVATMPRPARAVVRTLPSSAAAAPPPAASVKPHSLSPTSFNDAQEVGDHFKVGTPVILNLQGSDSDLSKRLIDFASGLTYALSGGMQRVADKVFLLTPRNVEVSAQERARLLERGGFFNQA